MFAVLSKKKSLSERFFVFGRDDPNQLYFPDDLIRRFRIGCDDFVISGRKEGQHETEGNCFVSSNHILVKISSYSAETFL